MKISDLTDREFKITALKMVTEDRRTMHVQIENFNRYKKYI